MPGENEKGGFIASVAPQIVAAGISAVTRGGPKRQYRYNLKAAQAQNEMNRANAEWTLEQNKRLQEEQRLYDSPTAQMERYKKAGLNPHLIYGSGSSAGSAFPIQSQGLAPARLDAPDASFPDIGQAYLQAGQMMAQTSYTGQREAESVANVALKSIMTDIAKTNPMLDKSVYENTIFTMNQTAQLKAQQAGYLSDSLQGKGKTRAMEMIDKQIELMSQKIGLNTKDLKIRNEILEGKEFQNELLELQRNWMKDADITPEHIRQGLMLLLQKMVR